MNSLRLARLPQEVQATAFVSDNELAWLQRDCPLAIEWFRQNGLAVLGKPYAAYFADER